MLFARPVFRESANVAGSALLFSTRPHTQSRLLPRQFACEPLLFSIRRQRRNRQDQVKTPNAYFIAARRYLAKYARGRVSCEWDRRLKYRQQGVSRFLLPIHVSAGGSSKLPTAFSPGIAYRSSAQAPKSINLQRSLQNGRNGLSLLNSIMVPHCGHRTRLGIIPTNCNTLD